MRTVIVSDVHLVGPHQPRQQDFVGWLGSLRADRLVLLGDIFHCWWSVDGQVPEPAQDVWAAVFGGDWTVWFVPGNHDFQAVGCFQDAGALVGEQLRLQVGEQMVLLTHGDQGDTSHRYRLARRVLRSRLLETGIGWFPGAGIRGLERLAGSPDGPATGPVAGSFEEWAEHCLQQVDVVISGHTHTPFDRTMNNGRWINTGDWVAHRTWVEIEDGQLRLVESSR